MPLLLRPPLPPLQEKAPFNDASDYFQCHFSPPKHEHSIDRHMDLNPMTNQVRLMRDYFGFLLIACGIVFIFLRYRCILTCCSFRSVKTCLRKCRRCLCGRPTGGLRLEGEAAEEMQMGNLRAPPRGIVVETVHTSLTYRLVRSCIQCQQRR